ncbi:MAG: Gfo/Idh/MocA family oxidoreductase [Candidatus Heimdallarchaeota archaeon]|nr:Gfo/Idh/MocA family oxidoreductase [Candidatus Heimdallarchaeota archaeon]MDH5646584.1 Gfo/Idh/MocA family oxidoreductase [Candidatus Heimdallarchaeota archaeon]
MAYKVGIIGTGFGVKVHFPAMNLHPDFEVKIIAGRNPDKTKQIGDQLGIQSTTNWKELINDDELDIIAVTPPPYLHYKMAKATLLANKHLLLEKPTTTTAHQAKKLVSIANDRGLIGMMCHEFRWDAHRQFFEHLVKHKIGKIREFHGNQFMSAWSDSDTSKWRWIADAIYDGGILGAAASHYVDMIRSTSGMEIAEVFGQTHIRVKQRVDGDGNYRKVTADDGYTLMFELENGATGVLNHSATINPAPDSHFIFGGDKGTAMLRGRTVLFGEAGDKLQELEIPEEFRIDTSTEEQDIRIPPFIKLLDAFAESLKEGKSKSPNLIDGWRNQQALDAVRLSHHTGNRIKINNFI